MTLIKGSTILDPLDRAPTTRCAKCGYRHEGPPGLCEVCLTRHAVTNGHVHPGYLTALEVSQGRSVPADVSPEPPIEALDALAAPKRDRTPGACVICKERDIASINAAIREGVSFTLLVAQYGHSSSTLGRHRRKCLGFPVMSRAEIGRKGQANHKPHEKQCGICNHPDHEAINAQLRAGATLTTVATRYGYSENTYSTHRMVCLGIKTQAGGNRKGKRTVKALTQKPVPVESPDSHTGFATHVQSQLALLRERIGHWEHECALLEEILRLEKEPASHAQNL